MAVPPPLRLAHAPRSIGSKAALREDLRRARSVFVAGLGRDGLAEAVAAVANRLAPLLGNQGILAGYAAHRDEPDVMPAMIAAHAAGRALALPRATPDGAMRFVGWRPGAALAPGFAGIAEPADASEVAPTTLLVPLVGFDRAGHRLGQGLGCYDRWLARHPGVRTIGVAWSVQEAPLIPTEGWDMPLDLIVTETGVIEP